MMAHIPYGYRIVNGRAVSEPEESGRVRDFFGLYLSGLSITNAKEQAGIPVSVRTASDMLQRAVYLGDDYYPAIIDTKTFNMVAEEKARRHEKQGNRRAAGPKEAVPVKRSFRIVLPQEPAGSREALPPAAKAALLYSMIIPAADGDLAISPAHRDSVDGWMHNYNT